MPKIINEDNTQYIYLLQVREFVNSGDPIYKVGMTRKKNHERFNQYPKGSILLFQMICNNSRVIENKIINKFKENFNQRKDIGTEYFEGEYNNMINVIFSLIKSENDERTIYEITTSDLQEQNTSEVRPQSDHKATKLNKDGTPRKCNLTDEQKAIRAEILAKGRAIAHDRRRQLELNKKENPPTKKPKQTIQNDNVQNNSNIINNYIVLPNNLQTLCSEGIE